MSLLNGRVPRVSWLLVCVALVGSRPAAAVQLTSAAIAENADGRLEVFGTGVNGRLYHRWQLSTTDPTLWGVWETNSDGRARSVDAARSADGRLVVAYLEDGVLVIRYQIVPNGVWDPESKRYGHDLRSFALARNADQRLEIFAIGGDKALYSLAQVSSAAESWQEWRYLGGVPLRDLAVTNDTEGRLLVVGLADDGAVRALRQATPNGVWGEWLVVGGVDLQQAAAATDVFGTTYVFALGSDARSYRCTLEANGNCIWESFADPSTDGQINSQAVAASSAGTIQVVGTSVNGWLFHRGQRRKSHGGPLLPAKWAPDWTEISNTPGTASWARLMPRMNRGMALLTRYGDGSLRLATSVSGETWPVWPPEKSATPTTAWFDLGQPSEETLPDLAFQFRCCLDNCPLAGALGNIEQLKQDLIDGAAGLAAGTPFETLASSPSAAIECSGGIGTVGLWLNRPASPVALRSLTILDDGVMWAASISENTIHDFVTTVLPRLPNHFSTKIKPQRNGPLFVKRYELALGEGGDRSCEGREPAEVRMSVQGHYTVDSDLRLIDLPYTLDLPLQLCIDQRDHVLRCEVDPQLRSPRAEAAKAVAGFFVPWVFNFAAADFVANKLGEGEDGAASRLGQCDLARIITPRIPLSAKKETAADIRERKKTGAPRPPRESLVLPYDRIDARPGLGLVASGPNGFCLEPECLPSRSLRKPEIIGIDASKTREPFDAPGKRAVDFEIRVVDLRTPIVASWSSTQPASFVDVKGLKATVVYDAPPGGERGQLPQSRISVELTDADGLTVSSTFIMNFER